MCGIAGIKSVNGQDVSQDLIKMLREIKHRGPDGSGVYISGNLEKGLLEDLRVAEGSFGLGHNLLSIVGTESSQPIERDGFILIANAEIYNFRELKKCLKDDYSTDSDCEVIISVVKKFYNGSLLNAVKKAICLLDGDYAFAIYDGKDFVVVRDPMGIKPLYYGQKDDIFAFASERKALWAIGVENVETLPPSYVISNGVPVKVQKRLKSNFDFKDSFYELNSNLSEVKIKPVNDITIKGGIKKIKYDKNNRSKEDIKLELTELLTSSVEKRIRGLSEVGIIFSGGVDSTVIAKLSDDLGVKTTLYTVGHETSSDIKFAKKTAVNMGLPLKIRNLEVDDVKKYTELVLNAIEEFNIMKLGVGMPVYIASELAHMDGLKVVLSGQGADEIFGGYHRYIQLYKDKGEKTSKNLEEDIYNLYHVNLQRDDAVTMANSVEMRVPYLDLPLVNMAMKIPMKYKIDDGKDSLRKCILREIALDIGVPLEIVKRPKKAAQYGSGVHKILMKKVLRDENYKNKLESLYKH